MLKVPDSGMQLALQWLFNSTPEALSLKLYRVDYVPVAGSTASNFTVANFAGYADRSLTRASWSSPALLNGVWTSAYPSITWTNSGGGQQTIYGAFVVGSTSGTLFFAERFDVPEILAPGDSLTYTPRFQIEGIR